MPATTSLSALPDKTLCASGGGSARRPLNEGLEPRACETFAPSGRGRARTIEGDRARCASSGHPRRMDDASDVAADPEEPSPKAASAGMFVGGAGVGGARAWQARRDGPGDQGGLRAGRIGPLHDADPLVGVDAQDIAVRVTQGSATVRAVTGDAFARRSARSRADCRRGQRSRAEHRRARDSGRGIEHHAVIAVDGRKRDGNTEDLCESVELRGRFRAARALSQRMKSREERSRPFGVRSGSYRFQRSGERTGVAGLGAFPLMQGERNPQARGEKVSERNEE